MKTIKHHAAAARIVAADFIAKGVLEVVVSGPLSQAAFDYFRPEVLDSVRYASAVVVRLDTALDVLVKPPAIRQNFYSYDNPPSQAVVCHAAQYGLWQAHGRRLASIGIRRAVFAPSQLDLAYLWAGMEARDRLARGGCAAAVQSPLV